MGINVETFRCRLCGYSSYALVDGNVPAHLYQPHPDDNFNYGNRVCIGSFHPPFALTETGDCNSALMESLIAR